MGPQALVFSFLKGAPSLAAWPGGHETASVSLASFWDGSRPRGRCRASCPRHQKGQTALLTPSSLLRAPMEGFPGTTQPSVLRQERAS